jgi:DeoR/GlpR family transcriptional regulator of sugar metabolism
MRNHGLKFRLNDRQEAILALLERDGRVRVADLALELAVSDVTIRKDLQELERLSLLRRIHGGAVTAHRSKFNLPIGDKIGRLTVDKLAIAEAALQLIHEGDTIILDAGSTTLALARLLPGRIGGLTVVTNSLTVIAELSQFDDFDVISLGGTVRHHSLAMIGPLTVASLTKLHADLAFLGATGASLKHGLCTPNIIEAETKAGMVEAAAEAIALVDHTKIGQASLAPYAAWTDVARLVTDLPLPADFAERIGSLGVAVTVAAPRERAGTELPELEAAGGA